MRSRISVCASALWGLAIGAQNELADLSRVASGVRLDVADLAVEQFEKTPSESRLRSTMRPGSGLVPGAREVRASVGIRYVKRKESASDGLQH